MKIMHNRNLLFVGAQLKPWRRWGIVSCLLLASLVYIDAESRAGQLTLKNGTIIRGTPIPVQGITAFTAKQNARGPTTVYSMWMVDNGWKRYFVPYRQVQDAVEGQEITAYDEFNISQPKTGRKLTVASVGSFRDVTPFSEFGRRTVTLGTSRGDLEVVQGMTNINPEYVTINGINYQWEFGMATSSFPSEQLSTIIRNHIDELDAEDRLAVARFFTGAGMYQQAQGELDQMKVDFPEMEARIKDMQLLVRQQQALQILNELKRRRDAAQHGLAFQSLKQFPMNDVNSNIKRQVVDLRNEYERSIEQASFALIRIAELLAEVADSTDASTLAGYRAIIADSLNVETFERLQPFLRLEGDARLTAEEKLSLAFSGWVVGPDQAVSDLRTTKNLWKARFLMLEYLRTENATRRKFIVEDLEKLESIDVGTISQLLDDLPLPFATAEAKLSAYHAMEIAQAANNVNVRYHVMLPTEYNPDHTYPAMVVLHDAGREATDELKWWAGTEEKPGQARRHGYIVIAPEYMPGGESSYDFSAQSHEVILESLKDARKRFRIDSDRVTIAGHGMGGDAVFDVAMSHPEQFAGAIPITGLSQQFCQYYWENAGHVSWYIIGGELDRNSLEKNADELNRMMKHGYDVIYLEFKGRGYETYYEEIHNLFSWMNGVRRVQAPEEIEDYNVLRPTDNSFYWFQVDNFRQTFAIPNRTTTRGGLRPLKIYGRITPGNTIYVRAQASSVVLNLNPSMIDYEDRLQVRLNSRRVFNDFPEKSIATMLETLRQNGDREKRVWTQLVF